MRVLVSKIHVVTTCLFMCVAVVSHGLSGCNSRKSGKTLPFGMLVDIIPGVGIKDVCECGMPLGQILDNISPCDKYEFSSYDSYVKYEWGLSLDIPAGGERVEDVRCLCFHVLPAKWALSAANKTTPNFTKAQNLFRGTVAGGLDFSSGPVTSSDVFAKFGNVETTLVQGGFIVDKAREANAFAITHPNGDYVVISYNLLGVTFTFTSNHVDSIYITAPLPKQ